MSTPGHHRGDAADHRGDAADRTVIVLRPLASPMPLGFLAFCIGMVLTSLLDLAVFPVGDSHEVGVLLLAFTGPLEVLAAVFAMLARDAGAGTAFAVFGATWISTGLSIVLADPGSTSPVTAAFFLALAALLVVLAVAARPGKPALTVLLSLASVRFVLSGLYEATGSTGLDRAAGIAGAVIAVVSLYGGLALLLEDAQGRLVLPTGRRGRARESFEGTIDDQLSGLQAEAGVRNQL